MEKLKFWQTDKFVGFALGAGMFLGLGASVIANPVNIVGPVDSNGYIQVDVAASSGSSNVNVAQVGGSNVALGQTTMSASVPVALASNQSNIPANVAQVGGASLALGQTTKSASVPVTLASDQGALTCNMTDGGVAITGPFGQAAMASSVPVVIASNQGSVPVTCAQGTASNLLGEVQGTVAAGSAASNPVVCGGADSSGNVQRFETEGTATGPIRSAIFNGSNEAAVKAASTSAVAGDPALVCAISPNTANVNLPVTTAADQAADAGAGTNVNQVGLVTNAYGTTPTADPGGKTIPLQGDQQGKLYVNTSSPNPFNCNAAPAGSNTECEPGQGASLSLYVTDVTFNVSQAANGAEQLMTCDGGTTVYYGPFNFASNGGLTKQFATPIKFPAGADVCCAISGTDAGSCSVQGFIAK